MTTALEQLIKMHDPRCVSIEALNLGRGRTTLSQEQIVGAFASCQHSHPVGFDLLMTKYRNDCKAEQRVRAAISAWLHKRPHPPRAIAACQLSLNMVLERNLPAQTQQITTLLLRYGSRTKMTRKVVEDLKQQIKQLERDKAQTLNDDVIVSLGKQITALQSKIRTVRGALRACATQEASRTQACPRCRGVGKTLRPHPELCNECGGHGRFNATLEDLRKSMGFIGPEIGAAGWAAHYVPMVKECLQWLYSEESSACEVLMKRIRLERSFDDS
ncbi:TPA: TIGR02642 family protein [Yersinia enterocolitica]|uniref:TIGR02642 family protein n=1 Tax=Yersinia enterocolitica TaxID=630 RepID=UPI000316A290|nr:TIGR02642 family protein [Yersinia enterocolitica]